MIWSDRGNWERSKGDDEERPLPTGELAVGASDGRPRFSHGCHKYIAVCTSGDDRAFEQSEEHAAEQ